MAVLDNYGWPFSYNSGWSFGIIFTGLFQVVLGGLIDPVAGCYTHPNKLLYESLHPDLLPLEKG